MARRKNPPESVRTKGRLAERLREVRSDLFGERGGPELARRLGLPIRTWYNYEIGVTVPAEAEPGPARLVAEGALPVRVRLR